MGTRSQWRRWSGGQERAGRDGSPPCAAASRTRIAIFDIHQIDQQYDIRQEL